ncbi:MFS transporter [Aquamicrobium segne]|uniref:MFS transporter n=1 Tax=Aquamicrobium segne TaxID=469547 RepID=A0ABW0GTH7_9HYPH
MASANPSLTRLFIAAGGIYTAQSLVGGLTFLGVPAVLRAENVALDKIGMVSLAMLVWAVKFLWAAPVERRRLGSGGHRRSRVLMLAGEGVVALALVAFALAAEADFTVILSLLIIMAAASATVDIVCDAYLIEQFPQERRGLGNIAQVGGGYLGLIFGSGLFVFLYSMVGWAGASVVLALLVVLMSMPMALTREPKVVLPAQAPPPRLSEGFRRPEVRIGIVMAIVFELGGRLAQALAGPFLVDAGLSLAALGLLNGGGGVAAGLAGTLAGGFAAQRLGASRAMMAVACVHVLTLGALTGAIVFDIDNLPLLTGLFVLEGGMMAAGFVVSYARLMALASSAQPGVDFTIFQCASAIVAACAGMAGGVMAARAGYPAVFMIALLAACAAPVGLVLCERFLARRTLP